MGKSGSLKAALQSQQSRLRVKQKVAHAAQVAEQKFQKNGQSKGKSLAHSSSPRATTIPFHASDTILLIGEGNFSFARALIQDPPAQLDSLLSRDITATAYDTEEECYVKYPDAEAIVEKLRDKGMEILFGVDAAKLGKVAALKNRRWDRIVWNFPHAGKGITDQDRNILSNQLLVLGFLRSAAEHLTLGPMPSFTPRKRKRKSDDDEEEEIEENPHSDHDMEISEGGVATRGTVLITLRNVSPYTLWNIPRLAKNPPGPTSLGTKPNPKYHLLRSFAFNRQVWSGYEHRMTKGERAHGQGKTGEGGEDRTWEFCLRDVEVSEDDEKKPDQGWEGRTAALARTAR